MRNIIPKLEERLPIGEAKESLCIAGGFAARYTPFNSPPLMYECITQR